MKYYDVNGNEISKYAFTKRANEIKQQMSEHTLICSVGKTGTGESYKRLMH